MVDRVKKDSKIRCAVKGCPSTAREIVSMVSPNGNLTQVQMCKICKTAYSAGQRDGWNRYRELRIIQQVVNSGY